MKVVLKPISTKPFSKILCLDLKHNEIRVQIEGNQVDFRTFL